MNATVQDHHPCTAPGCTDPTRLYAGGWRCEKHLPLPFDSDILGRERQAA
jgi:hypothetical protein